MTESVNCERNGTGSTFGVMGFGRSERGRPTLEIASLELPTLDIKVSAWPRFFEPW